jgi:hypothetical protein
VSSNSIDFAEWRWMGDRPLAPRTCGMWGRLFTWARLAITLGGRVDNPPQVANLTRIYWIWPGRLRRLGAQVRDFTLQAGVLGL